jgi:hypothetical protein
MSRIKGLVGFVHAWRHPDETAREVEAELRFHIAMRTRANIEGGMKPDQAQLAARQSFGDFDRVKTKCCEISRSLPVNSTVLKMGMYITIAVLSGGAALVAVNLPHHNLGGVLWQLVAIAVLARAFIVGRRAILTKRFADDAHSVAISAHDEHGRTPVERILN